MKKIVYVLFAFLLAFGLAAGAAGKVSAAEFCVNPDGVTCPYTTISAAIAAATPGDTITVAAGTYAEVLSIYKPLTLIGAGEGATFIDASASTGYGMDVYGDGVTLQGFTFTGPATVGSGKYGIKVTGNPANVPNKGGPFTIQNVTIQNSGRTGLDLNGLDGVIISFVTATANNGVGVALTDVDNAVLDHVTTSGNSWGGVAVFTKGASGYTGESDNVSITNLTAAETHPIYVEVAGGFQVTNLDTPQYPFQISNSVDAPGYTFFRTNLTDAMTLANSFTHPAGSVVANFTSNDYYVSPGMSIQGAINAAAVGDTINIAAGEYTESFTVNKHVKLVGAGSGSDSGNNTILKMSAGPAAITVTGSGVSDADPVLFQDLRVSLTGGYGFLVPEAASANYVKMDGVAVACGPLTYSENEAGLWVMSTASLRYFTVVDSSFSDCDFGWYFQRKVDSGPGGSMAEYINVQDTLFSGNSYKGFYAEKLSEATFTNVTVENTSLLDAYFNIAWNAGIDINLKGREDYRNLVFNNLTITGNGVGSKEGVGLALKARSDGPTYGAYPATLDNVQINGGTFTLNERGIRIGEPGKNNPGPTNVVITGVSIFDNKKSYGGTDGSLYGDVANVTTAVVTLFGNPLAPGGSYVYTPGTLYVDDNWAGTMAHIDPDGAGPATSFGYDAFSTIQSAVNTANSGDNIEVAAGTYTEQVSVNKSITLVGENRDTTIIKAPASIPSGANGSDPNSSVVKIYGSGVDVELSGFTVSGPGPSGCGSIGYGIVVRDGAHANIHDNKILDIRDEPFSGCQNGVGIIVGRSAWSTTGTAEITDNIISGFQKNGLVVSNTGSSATISGNTITGAGPTIVTAQNGIQVSSGATATISGNTVSGISYTQASTPAWTAAGILIMNSPSVTVDNNIINESQTSIYSYLTDGTFTNNTVNTTTTGVGNPPNGLFGVVIEAGTVSFTGNEITNDGTPGAYGLAVYAGYDDDDTNVILTGNSVSGWDTGVSFDQCETDCGTGVFTGIEFEFNEVTGNATQVENLNVVPAVPASPNWWGSAANPGFDLDEFSFSPWCADQACTTFGYLASDVQDALDDLAPDSTFTLISGVYDQLVLSVPGTTLKLMDGAEIRPEAGPCFLVNADNVSIEAESPFGAVCVPPTFYDGLDLLKAVNGLRVVNMEFDGSSTNTLDGLNIGFGLTNFQFLNNYIHDFDRDGVRFTPGASPSGSMVMAGNLFSKNSGYGVNNLTPVSLTTTFNNWNDPKGPKGTNGDGYGGKQTSSPYVYADLLASSSGTSFANKVTTTGTITYAVKVSAANVYGAQFGLEFDPAKLELLSITDSGKMVHDAVCPIDTLAAAQDGTISYCGKGKLLNGTVTLYTLKFKVKPGTLAGTTTLDFVDDSVSFASSSTLASNFIYPGSMADVTVSIYDPASTTFNLSAQILLEGRSDSSETCMNLGSGIVKCMTDKWGNLSLDNLPAGSYVVKVSKLGYIDLPATLNKTLVVNAGKTAVAKLTLVAGDVDNNEVINLADAVAVANEWGHSGGAIVNPLADINADGTVNLLDLAIVAKNYNKTSSAYKSWKP